MSERLALVLAGGGLAGIAWETGFLLGVQDRAPDAARALLQADVLLGTSAGATVAAQISSDTTLAELYRRQVSQTSAEITPDVEVDDLLEVFEEVAGERSAPFAQRMRTIGRHAAAAATVSEAVRRAVIAARLPSHDWPDRRLEVTAVDIQTGELVVFDRNSGVGMVDAVAASCAVPLVWPPVTIGDRRFIDGGVASSANIDVVQDCPVVVMLAPTAEPGMSLSGRSLVDELGDPRFERSLGVFADEASLAAFGKNPLDPRCRAPSAAAGREQGRCRADEVVRFLAAGG